MVIVEPASSHISCFWDWMHGHPMSPLILARFRSPLRKKMCGSLAVKWVMMFTRSRLTFCCLVLCRSCTMWDWVKQLLIILDNYITYITWIMKYIELTWLQKVIGDLQNNPRCQLWHKSPSTAAFTREMICPCCRFSWAWTLSARTSPKTVHSLQTTQ